MEFGLIGGKLGHSFSKDIHEQLGASAYELCELAPEQVAAFLTKKDFRGINVTIPYKETVIPFLAEVSERARAIGAVNTIVNDGGRLIGDNTDFGGMVALLRRNGIEINGKKVLVLGSGGTSKTARAVAKALGAASVKYVSRTKRDDCITYEEAYAEHADTDVIINTTPVGMYPNADASPIDLAAFPKLSGVADAIYNPLRTRLVLEAQARGIPASGGLYMLVAQAVLAAARFCSVCPDGEYAGIGSGTEEEITAATERIFRVIAGEKESIVLTGMPGVGKTTVGRLVAKRLGREFVDCDEEIVRRSGCEIPAFFAEKGEKAFRDLEAEVIRDLSAQGGKVIATGGGAILRAENVANLRSNGRIFFLDRPIESIAVAPGRPLSVDREALMARYRERYPIYCATCDEHLTGERSAAEFAAEIVRLIS
ncbi:MAG: AAA family ATPase [Kiritimatiellae bacterium]|nr:AAA family ATPase [Kiritimatiellia bacterium]